MRNAGRSSFGPAGRTEEAIRLAGACRAQLGQAVVQHSGGTLFSNLGSEQNV